MMNTRVPVMVLFIALAFVTVNGQWEAARATFYGDTTGKKTMQGACGYGDLVKQGYGLNTSALSTALFNNGSTCGACYEIKCVDSPNCLPGAGSITITATNFCPPDYTKTKDIWCNPPQKHFDLSMPAYSKFAVPKAGIVPVKFRRVACVRKGGIKFEIKGNPHWILVLVYNVAGSGDVIDVKVKTPDSEWTKMKRNWGQNWQTGEKLSGKSLSFQVTTSGGKMVQSDNVAPAGWNFGQTYEGKNF